MQRVRVAALLLAPALLAFSTQAGAAKPQANQVKQADRPIRTLAMDGARVAYMTDGRVHVWNVRTGATSTVKGRYPSIGKHGNDVGEVAIAGRRVAVITRFWTGNNFVTDEHLFGARLNGSAHELAKSNRYATGDDNNEWHGGWIAGIVGSGHLLAVSTWTTDGSQFTGQRLSLITPSGLRTIASGPDTVVSESADAGHIAVLRSTAAWPSPDGVSPATTVATVGIYSASGALLREIVPSSASQIALSGNELVVLTETKTLEVYDWTTGTLLHTWPVATSTPNRVPGHLAVFGHLAVYAVDPYYFAHKLHLVNLTTGRDVVIAHPVGGYYLSHDAVLGPRGLVYVVNSYQRSHARRPHGKLVFEPLAKLLAAVG